jgi:hypothetical protein
MATEKTHKNNSQYICDFCDFNTTNKNDYNRHILTVKHSRNKNATLSNNEILKKTDIYLCKNCNKQYHDRTGLWRHKSKCNLGITVQDVDNSSNKDDIIQLLLKQNSELIKEQSDIKQIILEIVKNGTNNTINCNNNSNNKTFNLQVFLNETCKDAMNISDFVESVQLQVSDLENVGKVGYIEGISNIIIKNLQALEVNKRPVHCADQKREVMYVKEDNVWEKEDEANKKLRKAIRKIAHKNICMFKAYREKYPDCEEYDSKKNSQYNIIIYESMGGKGDNEYEKDTKIIKKIAKVVGIDKS